MKIRPGDVVHVRGRVFETSNTICRVQFVEETRTLVMLSDIVHVERRPLEINDVVRLKETKDILGKIIGIFQQYAWIESYGSPTTWCIDNLELAE